MTNYPTLEKYNEALQSPSIVFADTELRRGIADTSNLGTPLALCGGFALTYRITVQNRKFAVRCFHKKSTGLEHRYGGISKKLHSLRSPYFVGFDFQPSGIRIEGNAFPVVKMEWVSGVTLGEFIEANYRDSKALNTLRESLRKLNGYLEEQNIAHGDIQPGNVMVSDEGRTVKLIDYDGMFVDELASLGSSELGHRNFQHIGRTAKAWGPWLDRFSFTVLDVALGALVDSPSLWDSSNSDGDAILFRANDFADPSSSSIFKELHKRKALSEQTTNFAAVCVAPFEKVPSLSDFINGRRLPSLEDLRASPGSSLGYLSPFPMLDAKEFASCLKHVGERVELIGKIVGIKKGKDKNGKDYVFLNFGHWKGECVKISIWYDGLAKLSRLRRSPHEGWKGKWFSIIGLMNPPYRGDGYVHLSIDYSQSNQFGEITEAQAMYRLSGEKVPQPANADSPSTSNNAEILERIRKNAGSPIKASPSVTAIPPPAGSNQAILQAMRNNLATMQPAQTAGVGSNVSSARPMPITPTAPQQRVVIPVVSRSIFSANSQQAPIESNVPIPASSNAYSVPQSPLHSENAQPSQKKSLRLIAIASFGLLLFAVLLLVKC